MKPYLFNYSDKVDFNGEIQGYYDEKQQINYLDSSKNIKLIDKSKFGQTLETATIENSDPDELSFLEGTRFTKSIEGSDPDEFNNFGRTSITETIESSDPDEFVLS